MSQVRQQEAALTPEKVAGNQLPGRSNERGRFCQCNLNIFKLLQSQPFIRYPFQEKTVLPVFTRGGSGLLRSELAG